MNLLYTQIASWKPLKIMTLQNDALLKYMILSSREKTGSSETKIFTKRNDE